jgi:hypothetical protein
MQGLRSLRFYCKAGALTTGPIDLFDEDVAIFELLDTARKLLCHDHDKMTRD